MTLIVGIRCRDGIVMAADSAATYGDGIHYTIGQQEVTKLHDLCGTGIYASTGSIGASQQVCNTIRRLVAEAVLIQPGISSVEDALAPVGRAVAATLAPVFEGARNVLPLVGQQRAGENALCKSLVAIRVTPKRIPILLQLAESGAPEMVSPRLSFVALGSGQAIADPFIALLKRILWNDREPSVAEGRLVAAWTIYHVAKTSSGGVGLPLQLATLTTGEKGTANVEFANSDSLGEHHQAVSEAEEVLRRHILGVGEVDPAQDIPIPEASATRTKTASVSA